MGLFKSFRQPMVFPFDINTGWVYTEKRRKEAQVEVSRGAR